VGTLEADPEWDFKFKTRITALAWHQKYPNVFAVGSKHGDIDLGRISRCLTDSSILETKQTHTLKGVSKLRYYLFVRLRRDGDLRLNLEGLTLFFLYICLARLDLVEVSQP
jgi:hypothetical protein